MDLWEGVPPVGGSHTDRLERFPAAIRLERFPDWQASGFAGGH